MGLLDDIARLQFGKAISDPIRRISGQILLDRLSGELEAEKARQKELVTADEFRSSALPKVTSELIPQIMRELDRTTESIRREGDIYGKFIPAIAMLNPELATSIAQERFRREQSAFAPIREKVGLAETLSRVEERAESKRKDIEFKYDQLAQQKELATRKLDLQESQLRIYAPFKLRLQELATKNEEARIALQMWNTAEDNRRLLDAQKIKLMNEWNRINEELNNPLSRKLLKDEDVAARQKQLASLASEIDKIASQAEQITQTVSSIADKFLSPGASQFIFPQPNVMTQQQFINSFKEQYGRPPSQSELERAKGKYWQ